jgi:hypothetical protein
MVPSATLSPKAQAWMKALQRATSEKIESASLTLGPGNGDLARLKHVL